MKKTLTLLALLPLLSSLSAQELLSREDARRYAELTRRDPQLLAKSPLKIQPKLDQAVAARQGDYGGLVIPAADLTAEALAKVGPDILPIGELWLHHLGPMKDGRLIAEEDLHIITIRHEDATTKVPLCIAGVRKAKDQLELVLLGKTKEPILTVPLKPIDAKQDLPIALTAEAYGDSGKITLKLLGKHAASLDVTELVLW